MNLTDQPLRELPHANEIRLARAADRQRVASMTRPQAIRALIAVCDDITEGAPCPGRLQNLAVTDWLRWIRLVGKPRAVRILETASEAAPRLCKFGLTVGQMTPREAAVLAATLADMVGDDA